MSGGSRHDGPGPGRLAGLLGPVVNAAGLELESVRIGRAGRRGLLRVVVDGEHGVSLDDIAEVSRAVAARVDASDAMGPGPYTLEVSSPGVDRPLTEPRHWRRAAGRLVSTARADAGQGAPPGHGGRPVIEGRIVEAGPAGVVLDIDGTRREFGYAELGPGHVQVEFANRGAGQGDVPGDGADAAGGDNADGH